MKIRTIAMTVGSVAVLMVGLYLGSNAQTGTCAIGSDTGPGVPVQLAAQSEAKPAADKAAAGQTKAKDADKAAEKAQAGKDQKDQQPVQIKEAAPIVPIIAPDEGC